MFCYFRLILTKRGFSSTDIIKIPEYQVSRKSIGGKPNCVHTYRHDEVNSLFLRRFAKGPEKKLISQTVHGT